MTFQYNPTTIRDLFNVRIADLLWEFVTYMPQTEMCYPYIQWWSNNRHSNDNMVLTYARIFFRVHYMFREANSFLRA